VIDAQATLITIAEGIENCENEIAWLQTRADECCIALEPGLEAALALAGPEVDFTQDDHDARMVELFSMEG
jgi:hypothetical protein